MGPGAGQPLFLIDILPTTGARNTLRYYTINLQAEAHLRLTVRQKQDFRGVCLRWQLDHGAPPPPPAEAG
ncbi:MAG TPA: hypothetical protein GXX19_01060 [Syntrophomonadaceae bacterium]|nr:hypothetical protein [Syntrophomonadaceae bacterium]